MSRLFFINNVKFNSIQLFIFSKYTKIQSRNFYVAQQSAWLCRLWFDIMHVKVCLKGHPVQCCLAKIIVHVASSGFFRTSIKLLFLN